MEQINKNDFLNNVQGIINEMKNQVDAYANQVFEDNMAAKKAQSAEYCLENIINKNGINLRESIKNIASSEASSNSKLMETIEQYAGALNNGLYEERLYESFLNNISKFDYLLPVEKEIKRINEHIDANEKQITITKILEEMTTTPSYYIIPMIEEDACRYVKNPNDTNRVQLRAILCSFASDPYCNLMLNTLEMKNDVYGKSLSEKAMSINDKIKFVRQDANVSQIYSPVQYIKENESVFNANGYFFVKKGNTIATLPEEYLNQLSEKFLSLCQLVNDPHVTMFDDHIVLTGNDKIASIYEDHIDINGNTETKEALRNINEMAMKYDFDNNFFIMASCLCENFDNIAIINFGKHIELNHDNGVNVDMFRVGNNIYVNAVNENFMSNTFYQNVNPIQCRNLINKHMGINVASLFEDLIPSQEKILVKLNEAKSEYEESIAKYEESIQKLKDAKEKCISEDNIKKLDDALKSAEDKLKDLKEEYKEWQKKAKEATEVPESEETNEKKNKENDNSNSEETNDTNTEVEKGNEPIDAEDVEAAKAELTQPLQDRTANDEDDEDNETITDDDFDSYLEGNDNPENFAEEIPAEDNTNDNVDNNQDKDEINNNDNIEKTEEEATEELSDEDGFTEMPKEPADEPVDNNEEMPEENDQNIPEFDNDEDSDEQDDTIDFDQMSNDIEKDINNETNDELDNDTYVTPELEVEGYKIANITFDQNVKTGELFKTGNIIVITPMIDGNGKMFAQSNDYDFYIDETTHHPIINTPGIPVALYNAMYNAILTDPGFAKADAEGSAMVSDTEKDPNNEDIWYDADEVNKASDNIEKSDDEYFNFIDDKDNNSFTVTAKDDDAVNVNNELSQDDNKVLSDIFSNYDSNKYSDNNQVIEKEPVENEVIPTYKSDETEIELPAATTDNTNIPEINSEEAANPDMLDNVDNADDTDNNGNDDLANTNDNEIPSENEMPSEIDFDKESANVNNTDFKAELDNAKDDEDNTEEIDFDKELANVNNNDEDASDEIDFDKELSNLKDNVDEDEEMESAHVTLNEAKKAINKLLKENNKHSVNEAKKENKSHRDDIISINESKLTH